MPSALKIWILGGVVVINAMLTFSLAWSWQFVYRQYSYPIDFFLPLNATRDRIVLMLGVATVSVPLALLMYRRAGRELPIIARIWSLLTACTAASIAVSYLIWSVR